MAANRKAAVALHVDNSVSAPATNGNHLKIKLQHMIELKPLTSKQREFWESYDRGDYFTALHGVAGTGKTIIAIYKGLGEVLDTGNPFSKIVLVRSAVQSREIGHLPGDVNEKMSQYEQPYIQICNHLFSRKDAYDRLKEQDYIEFISTSFIRGMTFDNSIIIVDEVQNLSYEEIDTIMTRVGNQSKIIFCGDYRQTDLKKNNDKSGLLKFFDVAERMEAFTRIEFGIDDIVRSSLVKDYIIAKTEYEDEQNTK